MSAAAAAEAMAMGLVNAVVPHDQLDAEVARWCAEIMERSPTAIAIAKRSFKERRPVRELASEMTTLSKAEIDAALDPARQTQPGLDLGGGAGG